MNRNSDDLTPGAESFAHAANVGFWGLVQAELLKEGRESALASMDAVQAGRAFVECRLQFAKRGVSFEGNFCSHGAKAHLFSFELNPDSDLTPSQQTYLDSASAGLWGFALTALLKEGKESALASMDAVQAGRAFVKCELRFDKRGVSADGHFCSHNAESHLFSVTLRPPTAPLAPPFTPTTNP